MPPPKSPQYPEAVADQVRAILERTQGRAFVLFTSYAMMHAVLRSHHGCVASIRFLCKERRRGARC